MIVLVVVAGIAAFLMFRGCEDPEKKLVAQSLWAMLEAVEAHDGERLAEYIAADYTDRFRQSDEMAVRRVMNEVEHYPELHVELENLSIETDPKTGFATAMFLPVIGGVPDETLKKTPKYQWDKGKRLRLKLRKHGDRYLVVRADMGYSFGAAF